MKNLNQTTEAEMTKLLLVCLLFVIIAFCAMGS